MIWSNIICFPHLLQSIYVFKLKVINIKKQLIIMLHNLDIFNYKFMQQKLLLLNIR
jgi:hypothetical protein